tara:strand:+ start:9917 stop:10447 length:531 start_codon:yes stop_codon:yes gene_type:complete
VAEEQQQQEKAEDKKGSGQKPVLFIGLAIINLVFIALVAYMVFADKKASEAETSMEDVIRDETAEQAADQAADDEFVGTLVPLETFLVNLSGVRGGRLMKITMSLEVNNEEVQDEIEKRKPEIRDTILILLASKTFQQISNVDGKDFLREEVKDTLNSFLTKGKVKRVLFTEFFYN